MRWLNIFAALSGAAALAALASLRHLHADADFNAVLMAAVAQLSAAAAGLAIANRSGASMPSPAPCSFQERSFSRVKSISAPSPATTLSSWPRPLAAA